MASAREREREGVKNTDESSAEWECEWSESESEDENDSKEVGATFFSLWRVLFLIRTHNSRWAEMGYPSHADADRHSGGGRRERREKQEREEMSCISKSQSSRPTCTSLSIIGAIAANASTSKSNADRTGHWEHDRTELGLFLCHIRWEGKGPYFISSSNDLLGLSIDEGGKEVHLLCYWASALSTTKIDLRVIELSYINTYTDVHGSYTAHSFFALGVGRWGRTCLQKAIPVRYPRDSYLSHLDHWAKIGLLPPILRCLLSLALLDHHPPIHSTKSDKCRVQKKRKRRRRKEGRPAIYECLVYCKGEGDANVLSMLFLFFVLFVSKQLSCNASYREKKNVKKKNDHCLKSQGRSHPTNPPSMDDPNNASNRATCNAKETVKRWNRPNLCLYHLVAFAHAHSSIPTDRQSTGNHGHVSTALGYQQALSWCLLLMFDFLSKYRYRFYIRVRNWVQRPWFVCLDEAGLQSSSPSIFFFSNRGTFQKWTRGDDSQWASTSG